jgi:probable H4MPT-linked C1 transfer pathway protein
MIGVDVGGANLKVVDDEGMHIHYCPLWNGAPITEILRKYAAQEAAVVMSGELADSFSSKEEGIACIVRAVKDAIPNAVFYGTDAAFHRDPVPELAAANWLASADYLRTRFPEAVLVDMGSTTTDIVPLRLFNDLKGLTDLDRLQKGYLVYSGLLRTTIPALLRSVNLGGIATPVSSEYFATSADAHLVLGHISGKDYTVPSPDNAATTREASLRRLARVVCADLEEIGFEGAETIAHAFWQEQLAVIREQVARVQEESGASGIITAGIGAPLLAKHLGGTSLQEVMGTETDALPALAVREVAQRTAGH